MLVPFCVYTEINMCYVFLAFLKKDKVKVIYIYILAFNPVTLQKKIKSWVILDISTCKNYMQEIWALTLHLALMELYPTRANHMFE